MLNGFVLFEELFGEGMDHKCKPVNAFGAARRIDDSWIHFLGADELQQIIRINLIAIAPSAARIRASNTFGATTRSRILGVVSIMTSTPRSFKNATRSSSTVER
jgi:hypothetical protein